MTATASNGTLRNGTASAPSDPTASHTPKPTPSAWSEARPIRKPDRSVRARLLAIVCELTAIQDGSLTAPVKVIVRGANGSGEVFRFEAKELSYDALADLSPYERDVAKACTSKPMPRKVLAKIARKKLNPYFHGIVRNLVERGVLRETPTGILLPD